MVWWYIKEESKASVNFKKSNTSQDKILVHGLEDACLLFWDLIDFDPSSTYSPRDEANCQKAYLNWIYQERLYDLLDKYVALKFPDQVTKRREFISFSPMTAFLKKVYVKPSNEVARLEEDECLPFNLNGFDAGSVPSSPEWGRKMETAPNVLQNSALENCLDSFYEEELLRNLEQKLLKASASHEHTLQSPQHVTMTPVKIQPATLSVEKINLTGAEDLNIFKVGPEQQSQIVTSLERKLPPQQVAEICCGPSPHGRAQNTLSNGYCSPKKQFIPETGYVKQEEPASTTQIVTPDVDISKKLQSISEISPIAGRLEAEMIFFTPNSGSTSKQRSGYYSTESTPKYMVHNAFKHELTKMRSATKNGPAEQNIHHISPSSLRSLNNQNSERKYRDATHLNQSESPCFSDTSMEYNRALIYNKCAEVMQVAQSCNGKTLRLRSDAPSRLVGVRGIEGIRRTLSYADIPLQQGEVEYNQPRTYSMKQTQQARTFAEKPSEQQVSREEQEEPQQESSVAGTIARALQGAMQSLLWLQSFSDKTSNAMVGDQTINGGQLECNAYSESISNGSNQRTGQPYPVTSNETCNLESELTISSIQSDPYDKASMLADLCVENGSNFSNEAIILAHQENSSLHNTNRELELQRSSVNTLTYSTNNIDASNIHAERFATDSAKASKNVEGSNSHDPIKPSSCLHGLNGDTIPSDRDCVKSNSERRPVNLNITMPMYIPMDSDRWSILKSQKHTTPHKYSNAGSKKRTVKTNGKSSPSPDPFKPKTTLGNQKCSPNSSSMLNGREFPVLGMTPSRSSSHKSTETLTLAPMKYSDTAPSQAISNNDITVSGQIIPSHNVTCGNGYNSYSSVLKSDPQTDPCLLNPKGVDADHLDVQHSNVQSTNSTAQQKIKSEEYKDLFGVPISEEFVRKR